MQHKSHHNDKKNEKMGDTQSGFFVCYYVKFVNKFLELLGKQPNNSKYLVLESFLIMFFFAVFYFVMT